MSELLIYTKNLYANLTFMHENDNIYTAYRNAMIHSRKCLEKIF